MSLHGALSTSGAARGGSFPLWVDVQKLCNMCVLSLYHTTNTLQGRRAKSHVDTQTIQPGLGDFVGAYSRPPIDPYLTYPPVTKSWRRHCCRHRRNRPSCWTRVTRPLQRLSSWEPSAFGPSSFTNWLSFDAGHCGKQLTRYCFRWPHC